MSQGFLQEAGLTEHIILVVPAPKIWKNRIPSLSQLLLGNAQKPKRFRVQFSLTIRTHYPNSRYSNSVLGAAAAFSWASRQGGHTHTGCEREEGKLCWHHWAALPQGSPGWGAIQGKLKQNDRRVCFHDPPWSLLRRTPGPSKSEPLGGLLLISSPAWGSVNFCMPLCGVSSPGTSPSSWLCPGSNAGK